MRTAMHAASSDSRCCRHRLLPLLLPLPLPCSQMSAAEKARVLAEGKAVLKDQDFLEAIADRTGLYMDLEVWVACVCWQPGRRGCGCVV